jgi:diacylglycerol kinase (ATP)
MQKAILLYNPLSGGRRGRRRLADVEAAAAVLQSGGVEVSAAPTRAAASSAQQVREAIAEGCDTIFACGGDGTIHDVLQGLATTQAALGIIPLGTANALAHDLRIPISPVGAAGSALRAIRRRVAVGKIEYQDFAGGLCARYFTVAAGIGVSSHLFYALNGFVKSRLGMAAYYAKACHLWMTYRMKHFAVDYKEEGSRERRHAKVTELLAVRIRYFGGILRELAPGADLRRNDLRLVLCRTADRSRYLSYVLRGALGKSWNVPGIELAYSDSVLCECQPDEISGSRVYVGADGELLGVLPARISVVPDALTILAPASVSQSAQRADSPSCGKTQSQ